MSNKLRGRLGINEDLYRELYQRAQRLAESAGVPFLWDGSKRLWVGEFVIDVNNEDPSIYIDYYPSTTLAVRRVLHVGRRGALIERGMADVRVLKKAVEAFRRAMILDDLANA